MDRHRLRPHQMRLGKFALSPPHGHIRRHSHGRHHLRFLIILRLQTSAAVRNEPMAQRVVRARSPRRVEL